MNQCLTQSEAQTRCASAKIGDSVSLEVVHVVSYLRDMRPRGPKGEMSAVTGEP